MKHTRRMNNNKKSFVNFPQTLFHYTDQKSLLGIVDDNKINQKVAAAILKKFNTIVDFADDGLQAYEYVTGNDVDIILMDIYMPVLDGLAATRKIRKWEKENPGKHRTIIGMTASAVKEDIDRCYASGMDLYLPKPVKIDDLLGAIRKIES